MNAQGAERRGTGNLLMWDGEPDRSGASTQRQTALSRWENEGGAGPLVQHSIHSRLLVRSTHLRHELGGGSLTALPIIETETQDIAAYIPTNLISITDGQLYLSPTLFELGILPAVDVGKSVSRVGSAAQRAAYRAVAGDLELAYSQFEELEAFSRFGTRLNAHTQQEIGHGQRIRACLGQPQFVAARWFAR
jgi:F0F1-type ATP synthase alpha subunit